MGVCHFNDQWLQREEYKGWVLRVDKNSKLARCKVCCKDFDIGAMGEAALKSHAGGKKHKMKMETFKSSRRVIAPLKSFFTKEKVSGPATCSSDLAAGATITVPSVSPEDVLSATDKRFSACGTGLSSFVVTEEVIKSEILWTIRTIESHSSYHSNERITQYFQTMFWDSEIAKRFSCGEKKTAYIACFGLAPRFSELMLDQVNDQNSYVMLFDESYNESTKRKQMDIHVRFWENGIVATRHLTSQFMGGSRATQMLSHVNGGKKSLKLKNLLQVSMDGPNVNWKFVDLFQKQIRDECGGSFLNLGSCSLHVVHGAFKNAMKATEWGLEELFSSAFRLFKESPARTAEYTDVTNSAKLPVKFCQHRWLENVPVAERILEIIPNLRIYVGAVKDKSVNDPKTLSYKTGETPGRSST